MKILLPLSFVLLFFTSLTVIAKPVVRDVVIERIHPMAMDRTHCPSCSGITRIYVNNVAWGDTACRGDAADLLKEDEHILSILLAAWISGKSIQLEVNDSVTPIAPVCKITAAYIK
ncbi:hypothetical protein [Teredinibacter sp. KSP-S5-2]|uniref:hypothetical protein n=1 Tax=Teredinibacter sp. KSP-S5-2 TaxID=3034506 RepID=UPI002934E1F9|nr:hypothetical protein [Teredinibacter sp. KSP-S5-2]WNO07956.1 hypothetical protein P5V12_13310 [Teredinibacter sp. KSP-S5-2]